MHDNLTLRNPVHPRYAVAEGGASACAPACDRAVDDLSTRLGGPRLPLSRRERQVLDLIAIGRSNKEIGRKLFVSHDTVKYHLKNLYGKLGSRTRTEAIFLASRAGLLVAKSVS